ncbi:hypothetical protein B7494_g3469 [Chlorociboria aeruginascens]|nr:hypothetical protein B7494_g3469 [Chlorociboria aeruginascens]
MTFITVAAATLPSFPLDFAGGRDRILESIRLAKKQGARLRTGPELEIPGYGALDHHLEGDTFLHSWEVLAEIIADPVCKDMLIDVGMGVRHRNVRYNCRVIFTFKKIYLIRPKKSLANDGLYREARHFSAWVKDRQTEIYYLEDIIRRVTGQHTVPIGDALISTLDTAVGYETCEELFTPLNPSTYMGLNGAEIILNSSASHAELRKLKTRLDLISNSTRKLGGIYVYANATGIDGEARMMFDGSSMVIANGKVLQQSAQFSLKEVDVITATIDIEEVRSFRSSISRNVQAAAQPEYERIECDLCLSRPADDIYLSSNLDISNEIELKIMEPMEEIYLSTAVYLWQYLVRTNSAGFFLALSGGLDSSTVALLVYGMSRLVLESIQSGEAKTLADLRRVTGDSKYLPSTPNDIVSRLLHTCYMGTVNSSDATRSRALKLSRALGAFHSDISIDDAIHAHESIIERTLDFKPRYAVEGGSWAENMARQNIQARNRMVVSYELAQLSTTARNMPRAGATLLVLGSGNVDEILRGYYTKYDASSADLAPLGSISKNDIKRFQRWARDKWDLPILTDFIEAIPTAELLPLSAGTQDDESESEMGLTYDELSTFGILRKVDKLGPWSAYLRLLGQWKTRPGYGPRRIAEKTMRFYRFYAMNRHKATIITPSIHLSAYNPDDNRHDLRPFLTKANHRPKRNIPNSKNIAVPLKGITAMADLPPPYSKAPNVGNPTVPQPDPPDDGAQPQEVANPKPRTAIVNPRLAHVINYEEQVAWLASSADWPQENWPMDVQWTGEKVLGIGGYGLVGLWTHVTDAGDRFEIVVKQSAGEDRALHNESDIMCLLVETGCPHPVKLFTSYYTDEGWGTTENDPPGAVSRIYMEHLANGDFERLPIPVAEEYIEQINTDVPWRHYGHASNTWQICFSIAILLLRGTKPTAHRWRTTDTTVTGPVITIAKEIQDQQAYSKALRGTILWGLAIDPTMRPEPRKLLAMVRRALTALNGLKEQQQEQQEAQVQNQDQEGMDNIEMILQAAQVIQGKSALDRLIAAYQPTPALPPSLQLAPAANTAPPLNLGRKRGRAAIGGEEEDVDVEMDDYGNDDGNEGGRNEGNDEGGNKGEESVLGTRNPKRRRR